MTLLNKNIIYKNDTKIVRFKLSNILVVFILFFLSQQISFSQQAIISGDTTICSGGIVNLNLSLEGDAPWSVTIRANTSSGTFDNTYNNIFAQDTVLRYNSNGNFRLVAASDDNGPISFSSSNIITANLFAPLTEAIISGNQSICEENSYNARIDLRGNAPWDITYSYNGGAPIEVSNILSSPYYLNISEEGAYSLVTVSDQNCPGTAVGTFNLSHFEKSTANLVGSVEKCEGEATPLTVLFSGVAPYELDYSLNGTHDSTIQNITTSPYTFKVKEPGLYEISEFVDNNGCLGIASGSATIANYPPVNIEFVNLSSTYALNSSEVVLKADPSGGEFKGDGVIAGTFFPELAVEYGTEPYEIIYTYNQSSTGCIYNDTAYVNVIDSTASIRLPGGRERFCSNEDTVIISGANIYNELGSFSISPNTGLVNFESDSAYLLPSIMNSGTYTITYTYGSGSDKISRDIEIEEVQDVNFIGLNKTEFCSDDSRIALNGSEQEGGFFTGPGIELDTINNKPKYFFNPINGNIGTNDLVFSYETPTGCISQTTETVIVYSIPNIDFDTQDSCVSENSPKPIKFINQTVSDDEIITWDWKFFNNSGSLQSTSSLENPVLVYETADEYNVSLRAMSVRGCDAIRDKDILFEESPQSNFMFSSECLNPDTSILFVQDVKSKDEVISYEWIFTDNIGTEFFNGDSISFKFNILDEHIVKLVAKTVEGCVDTFEESIQLKPTFTILQNGPYFEDFEGANSYWENEFSRALANNSWVYGSTENSFTNTANNKAWYTNLEYVGAETSWIKSPCFDFTNVERPFVKLNIWRDFEEIRDGANLQYTLDNGVNWNLVGTVDDGVNWYNTYQIDGSPGGHDEGWSNLKDNKWVTVRHRLDELSGKTNVQFRVVYGSDGTNNENFGVALDSIWFKERNNVVLLEHFTNSSNTNSLLTDSLINEYRLKNINDLIDIQYHTDFPGTDELNLVNPLEVNARLLRYGYSSVPLSIINGKQVYKYESENTSVTNNDIIEKSLEETNFEIDFEVIQESNNLTINYDIKSFENQNDRELFLYIVVLEDSVIQDINGKDIVFMNTFRKFLPDPGGISLQSNWTRNEVVSSSLNWQIDNVDIIENMKIVLFIQDEDDDAIIQAAIDKKLQPVSSRNNRKAIANRITAYPNPFNRNLMIKRNGLNGELKVDLLSISGNLISTSILNESESNLEIDAQIPSGYYFLRITDVNSNYTETLKLIKY